MVATELGGKMVAQGKAWVIENICNEGRARFPPFRGNGIMITVPSF